MIKKLVLSLALLASVCHAATLDVTTFGAVGDCAHITVSVTTNSAVINTTNTFTGADVGKVMQLFKAGYFADLLGSGQGGTFNGNYQGTPTNHQDLVVTILSVDGTGTNVTISSACGVTATDIRCTYGTQNKDAFDDAIAAATLGDTIYIPTGNYHLVPPSALDTNYTQANIFSCEPTILIGRGGLTFLGDGTNSTILTANGAWQQKGLDTAYRGYLVRLGGTSPTDKDSPLIFNGIQFDGNAARKHTGYSTWPAIPTDGSGWDVTHHAITDAFTVDGHTYKSYTNCLFVRWHGETLQGIGGGDGFVDIGNCWFADGNSTVINYNYTHDFHHCLVDDYYQFAEDGQFTDAEGVSYIRNNTIQNIYGTTAMALLGAQTNLTSPGYVLANNTWTITPPGRALAFLPAKSVTVISNYFNGGGISYGIAGYQGTDYNRNHLIVSNVFTNMQVAITVQGSGVNRTAEVLVTNNNANTSLYLGAYSQGAGGWGTNIVFGGNTANRKLWSEWAAGQYFIDDPSNVIPFQSLTGSTNKITYSNGARHNITAAVSGGGNYKLDDSSKPKIPVLVSMVVTNTSGSAKTVETSLTGGTSYEISSGGAMTFYWSGDYWLTNATNRKKGKIRRSAQLEQPMLEFVFDGPVETAWSLVGPWEPFSAVSPAVIRPDEPMRFFRERTK